MNGWKPIVERVGEAEEVSLPIIVGNELEDLFWASDQSLSIRLRRLFIGFQKVLVLGQSAILRPFWRNGEIVA